MSGVDLLQAIAGGAVVLAAVMAFYRSSRATGRARREALDELDGQWLMVGLSRGKGLLLEEEGFFRLESGAAVLDTGERVIYVPLGQIRWVVDVRTGSRLAGPW